MDDRNARFTNIAPKYGDIDEVTLEDYQAWNPRGDFIQEKDGIYELTEDGTWKLIAERTV